MFTVSKKQTGVTTVTKDLKQHWDTIFSDKKDRQLGWFEHDVSQTLGFLKNITINEDTAVFIAGAGTSSLANELAKTNCTLYLNDLSEQALTQLKQRLGSVNSHILCQDIAAELPLSNNIDIWLDRAVLHFLLSEQQVVGYFNNLKAAVKSGGYVLLAQFSKSGANRCAGLDVRQYDIAAMCHYLGDEFTLLHSEDYNFVNPFGQSRPYIYGLFRRQ